MDQPQTPTQPAPAPAAPAPAPAPVPTAPVAPPAPEAAAPADPFKPSKPAGSKKGLIIGIIVAVALLLVAAIVTAIVLITSANKPENMLKSAVSNLVTTKQIALDIEATTGKDSDTDGKVTAKIIADGEQQAVSVDAKIAIEDAFTLGLGAFINNENVFFKVNGIGDALDMVGEEAGEIVDMLGPVLEAIDDQWIKISADDLQAAETEEVDEATQCVIDALGSIKDNKISSNDATKIYSDFVPFDIVERLETVDGLTPLQITANDPGAQQYIIALVKAATSVDIQKVVDCTGAKSDVDDEVSEAEATAKVVAYIGGGLFDRTLDRLVITSEDGSVVTINLSYENIPALKAPEGAKTIEDIMESLQDVLFNMVVSQYEAMGYSFTPEELEMLRGQMNMSEVNPLQFFNL